MTRRVVVAGHVVAGPTRRAHVRREHVRLDIRRPDGKRFECTRCGGPMRIPLADLLYGTAPAICVPCQIDDCNEVTLRCPRAPMVMNDHDMWRWTDDPTPPTPPETEQLEIWGPWPKESTW